MSLIAERSNTSAGLIYHHFASKEEIIQALYERIYILKMESILDGFTPEMDARQAFVQGCERIYLLPQLGQVKLLSNAKAKQILNWTPRSTEECIVAKAESLQHLGLLKA